MAQAGDGNNIGNIVSLCLTPGNSSLAADFCFQPGGGLVIDPIQPGLAIVPDNPDYTLDPNGLGGSGKGTIGEGADRDPLHHYLQRRAKRCRDCGHGEGHRADAESERRGLLCL
ncbi:Uncharacterised protein [Enterobacter cloacae]|uniref:Uncharacterized protein n=1 Tax=Enterobacter cloacae TaxID=550 RepID=A0A377LQF0_ENTCL|nr:Uncharacterised protein [Enterobacter cloacae]